MMMTANILRALDNPATSPWLKRALAEAVARPDLKFAMDDARELVALLQELQDEVLGEYLQDCKTEGSA